MITFSTKYRSPQQEIMDDFEFQGDAMRELLTDLKHVNRWLGGNSITIAALSGLLKEWDRSKLITIVDLGCGDGELLRNCSTFLSNKGFKYRLLGLDANEHIIHEALTSSKGFNNISYKVLDVFSDEFETVEFDIALCTLFLHHYSLEEVHKLMAKLNDRANVGVVVNDLERNKLAFWLFKLYSRIFLKSNVARYDGLVSIARGFRKKELEEIAGNLNLVRSRIKRKWAFRLLWEIKNSK